MAFVALTEAETNAKTFLRQAFAKIKLKDNFDDHEARIKRVENSSSFLEHFNFDPSPDLSLPDPFKLGTGENPVAVISYPAFSVLRVAQAVATHFNIFHRRTFRFDLVTSPLIYRARLKKLSDRPHLFGARVFYSGTGLPTDAAGIWLERVDASNWRFVSYDTARNNGASFAKPTDGNWFTIEIEFTNDPSDRALCRVDGVLKETLITQLPTTSQLRAWLSMEGVGASATAVIDIDRIGLAADAMNDAT